MEKITLKGKKYDIVPITKSGIITTLPGNLAGGQLLTNGEGGTLKVYDARVLDGKESILTLECEKGRQDREEIFTAIKRYDGGLCAILEGEKAEGNLYIEPFDFIRDTRRILELLEGEFAPQWVHRYTELLDTAATNKLYDGFPTNAKYIYIKENTGTVTLKFDSQNEPSWTLPADKGLFLMPFEQLYLTWTAQAGETLTFYVSNREIKWTTVS